MSDPKRDNYLQLRLTCCFYVFIQQEYQKYFSNSMTNLNYSLIVKYKSDYQHVDVSGKFFKTFASFDNIFIIDFLNIIIKIA